MSNILLINETDVPLKFYDRVFRRGLIAPEMYNTVLAGQRSLIKAARKLQLKWQDGEGKRYYEEFDFTGITGDKTILFEVDPKTLLFEVSEYDGIHR